MDIRESEPPTWNPAQLLEFDITSNEIRDGLVSFRADTLAFRFTPRPQTAPVTCTVELREYLGGGSEGSVLLNGTASATVKRNQSSDTWLSFSGFGWQDATRTRPVTRCYYRVSLDCDSTVRVAICGEERLF
ncbi:hypothetical protein [Streptomyces sp. NBC_01264]|uniref:hypothetical protein n=1 Tax=Streptomyces sp. NBC_01264 TaxID=2903804 RepID=UPI00224F533E|nr:hypothetical protein [Streptomyces sp. NBC_01264]MCX4781765.1 hypothetical protein [Streptomyces sp. NBC_01264]